jgi:flagellar basal-body rod protein FlgB
MNIFGIETRGLNLAERMLDMTSKSALLVTSNVANSETPGYKALSIEFQDKMASAINSGSVPNIAEGGMAMTDPRHLPVTEIGAVESTVIKEMSGANINGNTVNMENEITKLNELNIKYSLYSNISSLELTRLKTAIRLR